MPTDKRRTNRARPEDAKEFAQQSVLVLGFLGAIAFTALVLLLENPSRFEPTKAVNGTPFPEPHVFFAAILLIIATVSVLSIVGSVCMMFVGSGLLKRMVPLYLLGFLCTAFATVGILLAIPFLLVTYSPKSADFIIYLGLGLLLLFTILLTYSMQPKKGDSGSDRKADQTVDNEEDRHSDDARPVLEGL